MPLIHDNPWLIEQLLKVAQEAAPPAAAPPPDPVDQKQQISDALHRLMTHIRSQLTPQAGSMQWAPGTDLSSNDMESMGAFVGWLAQHGTKMEGKQIVIPDKGNTPRPSEDYGYYRIEPGTEIAVVDEQGQARPTLPNRAEQRYWIQTDLLRNYLTQLQADEKLRSNVPFQWQLLKLIQDANSQFQMGIGEKYEKQISDQQYLDSVFNPMDPSNWGGDTMNTGVKVFYGDVKSSGNLVDWVKKNNIRVKKDGKEYAANDLQNFQICDVIGILYRRSHAMNPGSDAQEAVAAYRKATEALAQQNNCDTSNWGGGAQAGGAGAAGGKGDPAILQELLGEQLFDTREIDLNKIQMFAERFAQWSGTPAMNTIRDNIRQSVASVNSQLTAPGAPITVESTLTPLDWKGKFHNGNAGSVMATTIDNILDQAASMVYQLVNIVKRSMRNGPQLTNSLEQQLAGPLQANHTMVRKMARLSRGA